MNTNELANGVARVQQRLDDCLAEIERLKLTLDEKNYGLDEERRLHAEIERLNRDLLDAGMLIRRLCHSLSPQTKRDQAEDWLRRKGLGGSVLRECDDG